MCDHSSYGPKRQLDIIPFLLRPLHNIVNYLFELTPYTDFKNKL